jgi:hypothetical protein
LPRMVESPAFWWQFSIFCHPSALMTHSFFIHLFLHKNNQHPFWVTFFAQTLKIVNIQGKWKIIIICNICCRKRGRLNRKSGAEGKKTFLLSVWTRCSFTEVWIIVIMSESSTWGMKATSSFVYCLGLSKWLRKCQFRLHLKCVVSIDVILSYISKSWNTLPVFENCYLIHSVKSLTNERNFNMLSPFIFLTPVSVTGSFINILSCHKYSCLSTVTIAWFSACSRYNSSAKINKSRLL